MITLTEVYIVFSGLSNNPNKSEVVAVLHTLEEAKQYLKEWYEYITKNYGVPMTFDYEWTEYHLLHYNPPRYQWYVHETKYSNGNAWYHIVKFDVVHAWPRE